MFEPVVDVTEVTFCDKDNGLKIVDTFVSPGWMASRIISDENPTDAAMSELVGVVVSGEEESWECSDTQVKSLLSRGDAVSGKKKEKGRYQGNSNDLWNEVEYWEGYELCLNFLKTNTVGILLYGLHTHTCTRFCVSVYPMEMYC